MNSLQIDEDFLIALVSGDPRAAAIQESWKFNLQITEMSAEDIQTLSDRCRTTFNFPRVNE